MKKIFILLAVFFTIATQGVAQKFIDVYQNGRVAGSMFSPDIDSITISGNDVTSRRINFWRAGNLSNSFIITTVDSVKVFHSEEEPLVYLGILGFNQELYTKPIDILAGSTYNFYTNFVSNMTRKDGTLLYYAVDNALDMLTQYNFTTPLTSVNLVTFTDGLDQGSLMMTTDFENESTYLSYLSHRIGTIRVRGLPLTAYSLGLRGNDVTDYTQFLTNLRQLSTSDDNTIEVNSMSGVQEGLKEIADQIISISNRQTISTKIPGQSNETHVCFTFDGESPQNSSLYIEGVFNLADRSLHDVTYGGIRATSGRTVEGTQDGIFVTYTFTGLQRIDGNGLIPINDIRHYNQVKGSSTWQINSEFRPGNNTQTTVSHSGAAVMLVLDCSSSLGSQFSNMKSYANDFIWQLANNAASFSLTAPTNIIAAMDDEEMAVNVSWGTVKHAEYYTVYRSRYSNYDFTKIADSLIVTNWRDAAPLRGANYYRIYASGHGLQAYSTSNCVICDIAAPTNVIASLDDDMNIVVSWDSVKYAKSYSVYRSSNPSSNFTKVADDITATNWLDSAPHYGTNYYCIYAVSNDMTSAASSTSNPVNFELETPQNVTAVMDDDEWAVDVSWDAVKYAEFYSVYRSKDALSNFTKVADSLTTTNWRDEAPQQGANYYRICAMGHGLQSSNISKAVVCEIAPPTNLLAVMDDYEWATNVSWDPSKYAEFYSVYRSSNLYSNFTKVVDSLMVTNWRDEAPLSGNNYYRICAMGHGATSVASSTSDVVKFEISAPENVIATIDEDMIVDVSWDAVKFAEYYSVYRSNNSSIGFTKVADNIIVTTWRDAAPLRGANYYQIFASGHNLTSTSSNTSEVVNYEIAAPTNVIATLEDNEMVVNVSWDTVKYAEYYSVYRSGNSSSGFTKIADSLMVTNWRDEAPLQGSNYYCIYATGHGMTSEPSNASVRVICIIAPPANVTATMDDDMNVFVSWDAVKYAESYSVYRSNNSSSGFTKVADGITATKWHDEEPLPGNNYYRIYAMGHGLTSDASNTSEVVIYEISAPINVIATMDDDMNVTVSWDSVKYAESYSVYRSNNSSSNFIKVADGITATKWQDKEPLPGDNYYCVYAIGHGLTSLASNTSDVLKFEIAAPEHVSAKIVVDEWAVNLSWGAVQYAESYNIYRSNNQSGGFTLVANGLTTTSWKDESPLFGDNYYQVCAMGHGLTSSMSLPSNVVVISSFCPNNHHPHMIDLGLPSGTLWACCNVDTKHPENQSPSNYGGYYAWGETEVKDVYDWETYIHCDDFLTYHNIGRDIAGTKYDVAHVKWGDNWQMPSYEQFEELINNCTSESIETNGVRGRKFIGPNGYFIFLPVAEKSSMSELGYYYDGFYWSSTQHSSYDFCAYNLNFYGYETTGGSIQIEPEYKYEGLSVRPVANAISNQSLQLSKTKLGLTIGGVETVSIISGNGNYTVTSSNTSVAIANITGNSIRVTAVGLGTATITVTDTQSGQTATIKVDVSDGIQIFDENNPNSQIGNGSEILNNQNSVWSEE